MTSGISALRKEFGETLATLARALAAGDEALFLAHLDHLVQRRERALFNDLRRLTSDLQAALERFRVDSRLVDLAEKKVPDARQRLDHVLKLTAEAAHRTLDLVEQSAPIAERTAAQACDIIGLWQRFRSRQIAVADFHEMLRRMDVFLEAARTDMDVVRGNLSEVLMAQGYQDLSGQIIRGVITLVGEIEVALVGLVRLSKSQSSSVSTLQHEACRGLGPMVPGADRGPAVSGQQDVDSLLSGLRV